ncbi:hypothetical protein GCM10010178_92270 [Lentzea flava]|uniref:Uncharacterized protein n=1 Tax=Lentzea flava TaxID=103732 RepID=A0ABQ2VI38_9PSEU|nr:hypothetical protein GCM10010178_92270 [Lentzea flava]
MRAELGAGRPQSAPPVAAARSVSVAVTLPTNDHNEHEETLYTVGGVSFNAGATSDKATWDRLHQAIRGRRTVPGCSSSTPPESATGSW